MSLCLEPAPSLESPFARIHRGPENEIQNDDDDSISVVGDDLLAPLTHSAAGVSFMPPSFGLRESQE